MQRYFIFVFLIYLFPMYANSAENAMAMIDFENSESIQIAGDEKTVYSRIRIKMILM